MKPSPQKKVLLFANTDWYLYNFRLSLAQDLHENGWDVVLVSPSGDFSSRLASLGYKWIPFDFSTKSINPFVELKVLIRLICLYIREQPTLVHHFTIKCVLYGSFASWFVNKVSVVNAVTGLGHIFTDSGIKAKLLRPVVSFLYRSVLNNAQGRVIFQNEEDRMHFINLGLVSESLTRVIRGSGINAAHFMPYKKTNDQGIIPTILFASRLLREKGIYELLFALNFLKKKGVIFNFLLAGEIYPENPSSLSKLELSNINEKFDVTYLGHVQDMRILLMECDIVVLPSYSEGTPRILIEAAAMEKPIVCTNIAGCRGLVIDNVNGFLVPVKDTIILAEKIELLISNVALRAQFGEAGRKIVLSEFDDSTVIQKTNLVYNEILQPDLVTASTKSRLLN